jgi:Insertion element 4 transposase N-terminal
MWRVLRGSVSNTGCREKRSRRLPAHVMIRYAIAMGPFFDELLVAATRAASIGIRSGAQIGGPIGVGRASMVGMGRDRV